MSALGGGPLAGDRLVRICYLDEAGIGNPRYEPVVVVAGVIVHADGQLRSVEQRLAELADQYAPPGTRDGFVFHATDIFSGGPPFTRELYPDRTKRWAILKALCDLPHELSLPVVFGWVSRPDLAAAHQGTTQHEITVGAQAIASCICTLAIERHMRTLTSDEITMLIYEDNQNCRHLVSDMQRQFRSGEYVAMTEEATEWAKVLPVKHIMEDPVFSTKTGSSALQIADACAFALKRRLMGKRESAFFMETLEGQLILRPNEWPPLQASSSEQPS